jgi:hypothetical protein
MDERVVEGGVDVGNTKNKLALADLGAELDCGFGLSCLGLLGRLREANDIRMSAIPSSSQISILGYSMLQDISQNDTNSYSPCSMAYWGRGAA